jgi:hypothetical protein
MKVLVITSFNEKLFNEYAHRFLKTYNWPFDLKIYSEKKFNIKAYKFLKGRTYDYNKLDIIELGQDSKDFVERNKNRPVKDFWVDGVRFSYKVYSVIESGLQAINENTYDILIWVDADSVFHNPLTLDFMKEHLYKEDSMMTYLGRGGMYSECGFLSWNLKHKDTKNYFEAMKKMYNEDLLYNEKEYHDSYIWDLIRIRFERDFNTKNINIGDEAKGHIQARSILGEIYDHIKGPARKKQGYSVENKNFKSNLKGRK